MDGIRQDLRDAIRGLTRSPASSALIVLALALGIGANTAIFSLVDAVLFRPLPVDRPDELVRVFAADERRGNMSNSSYPVYEDYRDQADAFSGLAAYADWIALHLSIEGRPPERLAGALVTGNYFDVLGARPSLGRLLTPGDDRAHGAHPVAVVSDRLWRRRFGAAREAVGATVRINGFPFTIVGVAPRLFHGVGLNSLPDVWIPMAMRAQAEPEPTPVDPLASRRRSWLDVVGRLRPGVTLEQAQAQLDAIAARRAASQPEAERDPFALVLPASRAAVDPYGTEPTERIAWLLVGVVALVLIIACADAAGLLLARGEARRREIALRLSMGASRLRIVRQLLAESLVLSGLGAAGGVLLAVWCADLLSASIPSAISYPAGAASQVLHLRALAATALVALASGILFGAAPALRASRPDLVPALRGGPRSSRRARGGRRSARPSSRRRSRSRASSSWGPASCCAR